jgi:rhodanese-related sulfurtransferase
VRDYRELEVEQLKVWNETGKEYVLLDVREPAEFDLAAVPGALRIPMRQVPTRVAEIPSGKPLVVMCHLGERSARIARFLAIDGFDDVYNLEGGIDAYAAQLDPAVGRY